LCKHTALPQQEKAIKGETDPSEKKSVTETLRLIKAAGFNVIRIWAFNDGEGPGKLQSNKGAGCVALSPVKRAALCMQWLWKPVQTAETKQLFKH
jgi:hypothetical protein